MPPKCGTTTISAFLGVTLHEKNDAHKYLNDATYKKIIIYVENIVKRFLSGFYEDLFNNKCYSDMNITFEEYIQFVHQIYKQKIPNVRNLNCCTKYDHDLYYGGCSHVTLPITNACGEFTGHIQTQKYAIGKLIDNITCLNVNIIELNDLHKIVNGVHSNKKKYVDIDYDINDTKLSYMYEHKVVINESYISEKQHKIITEICEEDKLFIQHIKNKYSAYK